MKIFPNSLVQFLKSRLFLMNLAAAIVVVLLLFWVTLQALDMYTLHGQQINVPYLKGKTIDTVANVLKKKDLTYEITDSTYVQNEPPLAVIHQNPPPNAKVKQNRTIYLTVNATSPPKVKMPNVKNQSLRSAISQLKILNLKVGKTIYRYSQYEDVVLEQRVDGEKIEPGTLIPKGTRVDLVVGRGSGTKKVKVPDVVGLKLNEARYLIKGSSLNIGAKIFQGPVEDTMMAIVQKQRPPANKEIHIGRQVDLYLSESKN